MQNIENIGHGLCKSMCTSQRRRFHGSASNNVSFNGNIVEFINARLFNPSLESGHLHAGVDIKAIIGRTKVFALP